MHQDGPLFLTAGPGSGKTRVLRWNGLHLLKLELVRETKGSLDLDALQHSNEGRKVRCARKHFAALGMSHRHIAGDMIGWSKEEERRAVPELSNLPAT